MIQQAHIRKFHACKKYMPSDKEIKNLRVNIYRCIPILNSFIKDFGINDAEDLFLATYDSMRNTLKGFLGNTYIASRLYELQTMKSIYKDPSIIDKQYPNIKDRENTHTLYTADMSRTQRLVLINALDEATKIIQFVGEHNIKPINTSKKSVKISGIDKLSKGSQKLLTDLLTSDTIKDQLSVILGEQKEVCEDFVRQNETEALQLLHDFFCKFGNLDSYISLYDSNSSKFGFSDLDYNLFTDNTVLGDIGLDQSFSEDFLNSLPVEDLCMLTAFWYNRLAKECEMLNLSFLTINSLDLWQDILDGNTDFDLPDKALIASLRKYNFINQLATDTFNIHHSNIQKDELQKGINSSTPLNKDYSSYYLQLHKYINDEYSNFFGDSLHNNHFMEDVNFSIPFINLKMFAYKHKDAILEPIIQSMLTNNLHCKNWGLIRNELDESGNYFDSIAENRPMVLVSFDIEGFNMPFRFHISRDALTDLARLSTSQYLIPEYQGIEDFIINGELIPTNVMMPILKRHKKIIMDNSKIEGPNKDLWEHFYFLMNGKLPKHLTQTVPSSKKQTVATRLPINYTDLKTGKRYIQSKKEFIEVDDSNVR